MPAAASRIEMVVQFAVSRHILSDIFCSCKHTYTVSYFKYFCLYMSVYFLTCSCHKQLYIFCLLAVFLNILVCIFFHRKLRMAITRKDQGKPGKSRQGVPRNHDSKIIFQLSSRFRFSNCVGRLNSREWALTHCQQVSLSFDKRIHRLTVSKALLPSNFSDFLDFSYSFFS